jgi:hypothetical protein
MNKSVVIRVWNDKCDLTYVNSMYDESRHDSMVMFARNQCRRWMYDEFNIPPEESEDVKVEILFDFTIDGIINNGYFK